MITFKELLDVVNAESGFQLKISNHSIYFKGMCFADNRLPVSVSEQDYNVLYTEVLNGRCENALEIGTGLGVSTFAIGSAVKENGGKLLTIDSYEEGETDSMRQDSTNQGDIYPGSRCLQLAKWISSRFKLQETITFLNAFFPHGSLDKLEEMGKFDFVFLDCPKSDLDLAEFLIVLKPHLADVWTILIHDFHVFSSNTPKIMMSILQGHVTVLPTNPRCPIGKITNKP